MTRRSPRLSAAALALLLAACQGAEQSLAPDPAAPSLARSASSGGYIVVFDDATTDAPGLARRLATQHGGTLRFTYERAIKGMAISGLPDAAVEALARHPNVKYVEPDAPAELFATQTGATWGIDRIDQRDTPLGGTYVYNATGTGVNAYIFDTGINLSHVDFGGRARYVPNGANGDFVLDGRGNASDCHGHGTHVAGTIGGTTWGVAKLVNLWAARVVNCQGSGDVSMAIAAVDWCTASCARPAVVNMSLGYGDVQSLRDAVERSVAAGVNYAVSAGNGSAFFGVPQDACLQSPGGAPNVVTVGSTTSTDAESSFSNYGSCVDILAPGSNVTSASYSSNTGSTAMSGTSMASPHVAGAIALFLEGNPTATPAQVTSALKSNGTPNTITLHSRSATYGTPNLFLYTAAFGGGIVEPPPPPPPTDVILLSVSGTKAKNGRATANLSWSGSTATSIDVYRDGSRITTTANDGSHADNIGRVSGSVTYRVCNAGTTVCSSDASVTF